MTEVAGSTIEIDPALDRVSVYGAVDDATMAQWIADGLTGAGVKLDEDQVAAFALRQYRQLQIVTTAAPWLEDMDAAAADFDAAHPDWPPEGK